MVKAEWGTKRTCPKCGTRFYDLGKEDPVTCIECGVAWDPEPVLKSKQPLPFDEPKKQVEVPEKEDADLAADDLELDVDEDAEENPDDEVDLGGDEDIGVPGAGDEDEEI
ncbi:MAG TPA: TIGR02300 family protein [Allosphingosinicella sp.]|nr:TIGR02300 family protein [Allosphingosinicella sp.]